MQPEIIILDQGRLAVNRKFLHILEHNSLLTASALWDAASTPVKQIVKERYTSQTFLETGNGKETIEVYIKRYCPLSLKKRLKQIISFKKAFNNAMHEWQAILEFHKHGLATMQPMAAGKLGRRSVNMTLGIKNYTRASELLHPDTCLDTKCREAVISRIADFAAKMHSAGMAHQDFYLVHMFIDRHELTKMRLIDLQRVIISHRLATRWIIKDMAQLIFSAQPVLSEQEIAFMTDRYRQVSYSRGCPARDMNRILSSAFRKAERIRKRSKRKAER